MAQRKTRAAAARGAEPARGVRAVVSSVPVRYNGVSREFVEQLRRVGARDQFVAAVEKTTAKSDR